jgi:hypothetical protein
MSLPRGRLTVLTLMLVTVLAAFLARFYVLTVRQKAVYIENVGNPPVIPLDVVVLDAATGQPVRGAKVDLPYLHPAWRGHSELSVGDLRRDHGPPGWQPSPLMTDGGGSVHTALKAQRKCRIERRGLGLPPFAGRPEVVFHPVHGLRVEADGYETWVGFLNDITPDDGRRLDNLIPMPITIRLKPVDRRATPAPDATPEV